MKLFLYACAWGLIGCFAAQASAQTIITTATPVDNAEYSQTPGLLVIQGGGSLDLTNSATTTGIQALFIGDNSSLGSISVLSASVLSNSGGATVGQGSSATGSAVISGSGSLWTNGGDLTVANAGQGTMSVLAGAAASNSTGYIGYNSDVTGTVTIDGASSAWTNSGNLFVGYSGTATLNITDGGQVANSLGAMAFNGSSTATVVVDGSGSTWSNGGNLIIGWNGDGYLTVQNNGAVTNGAGYIGFDNNSSGTVTIDGGSWANSGELYVGGQAFSNTASGTLQVIGGGTVTSQTSYLGYKPDQTGTVTIDGALSTWSTSGSLYVGGSSFDSGGTASINITNGGTLTVGGTLRVWEQGSVTVGTGSTASASSGITLSGGALAVNGTLNGNVLVDTDAVLRGSGLISGAVVVAGGGTFSAGNSVGQIDTGDETWDTDAILLFEIRDAVGVSGTAWDRIDIDGTLTLNADPSNQIHLEIESWLPGNGGPGAMDDFNGVGPYSWLWVTTTSGIDAGIYDANQLFDITLGSAFLSAFPSTLASNFSVAASGNDLYIEYLATVPEPGNLLLASLAAVGCGGLGWRRRSNSSRKGPTLVPVVQGPEASVQPTQS